MAEQEIVTEEAKPVETPAPVAGESPTSTADEGAASAAPEEKPSEEPVKPERTFTQKELDEIVSRRDAKRIRQAERLGYEKALRELQERENQRLRSEMQGPTVQHEATPGEPRPDQFKDYESYTRALARWEVRQELAEADKRTKVEREQAEAAKHAAVLREKVSPGFEKYPDFEEVALDEHLPITVPMISAAVGVKAPWDVLYYLGEHREEASRISGLEPADQVREIDKIVAMLTKPAEPTKAPAPIVPNPSKGSVQKDPSTMTMPEYIAWRRRSDAARKGAA